MGLKLNIYDEAIDLMEDYEPQEHVEWEEA